jgi:hypothetical protein
MANLSVAFAAILWCIAKTCAFPVASPTSRPSSGLHGKLPKFSEASDTWPEDVDWAKVSVQDWNNVPEQTLRVSTVTISNDTPLWERILAHTLPAAGKVTPASAYLAPKGGCDNLCNENERYTDYCTFQISDEVEWLLIQTEEQTWKYRIEY